MTIFFFITASQLNGGRMLHAHHSRPTILGRSFLFQRYGEQEEAALNEFKFLNNFSTSYSDLNPQENCSHLMKDEKSKLNDGDQQKQVKIAKEENSISKVISNGSSNYSSYNYSQNMNENHLQHKKPLQDKMSLPHLSKHTENILKVNDLKSTNVGLYESKDKVEKIKLSSKCNNLVVVAPMERENSDLALIKSKNQNNCNLKDEFASETEVGIDTRSLCTVKAAIQKLNSKNHISGINKPTTNNRIPTKNASKSSISKVHSNIKCSVENIVSISASKMLPAKAAKSSVCNKLGCSNPNPLSSQSPSPKLKSKEKNFKSIESSKYSPSGPKNNKPIKNKLDQATSSTRIPKMQQVSSNKNKSSKRNDESPLCKYSPGNEEHQSRLISNRDASLPPKGSPTRHRDTKGNSNLMRNARTSPSGRLATGRSPRLSRLKLTGTGNTSLANTSDPLDIFLGKSLCDSGSSEGSERAGGRLSLSDSCAENFSPVESGDEVFHR